MFKDNKLRLLLTLVGFNRLGANEDPDATWVIPSILSSKELQESINLIRKYEFDPPTYDDGKGPEDMLRSKASAARRAARRVDWDDDDDGIEHDLGEDRGEYAMDEPTAREANGNGKKLLKRRRRARTPVELDDEEKQERANARRQKEIEKQLKVKSTMFVHDSDDEDDPEADAAFFAREEALRAQNKANIAQSLVLGNTEAVTSKKRKADGVTMKERKKRNPPKHRAGPFDSDESNDDETDEGSGGYSRSRTRSEERQVELDDSDDVATDTPLSSQLAGAAEMRSKSNVSATLEGGDITMAGDGDDDEEEEEEDQVTTVRRPATRNIRAGFIVDSDSE